MTFHHKTCLCNHVLAVLRALHVSWSRHFTLLKELSLNSGNVTEFTKEGHCAGRCVCNCAKLRAYMSTVASATLQILRVDNRLVHTHHLIAAEDKCRRRDQLPLPLSCHASLPAASWAAESPYLALTPNTSQAA